MVSSIGQPVHLLCCASRPVGRWGGQAALPLGTLSSKGRAMDVGCRTEQALAPRVDKQPWAVTLIKAAAQILLQLLKRAANSPP